MSDLYFEGTVTVTSVADGMVQSAEPFKNSDGVDNESFVIRLVSASKVRHHPIMDQLAGKRVRMTFTVLE